MITSACTHKKEITTHSSSLSSFPDTTQQSGKSQCFWLRLRWYTYIFLFFREVCSQFQFLFFFAFILHSSTLFFSSLLLVRLDFYLFRSFFGFFVQRCIRRAQQQQAALDQTERWNEASHNLLHSALDWWSGGILLLKSAANKNLQLHSTATNTTRHSTRCCMYFKCKSSALELPRESSTATVFQLLTSASTSTCTFSSQTLFLHFLEQISTCLAWLFSTRTGEELFSL